MVHAAVPRAYESQDGRVVLVPRVTIYPANSSLPGFALPIIYDAPEKCTALTIKRLAGQDTTSWLYVRLPRHRYDEKCDCYSCEHYKAGWWTRPSCVPKSEWRPSMHRWIRYELGNRNVRLTIRGGEHFLVVALIDMPAFATDLAELGGRHGALMALYWHTTRLKITGRPVVVEDEPKETLTLLERQLAKARVVLGHG